MGLKEKRLDALCVNTIRMLAVDMIEKAGSGHPGLPLGAAPAAYVLWRRVMDHNPRNPGWFNRDRFVLSAGHGSALLYALLHLSGYDLPLEELKRFRQWQSRTPGHPEYGTTPGVEVTTGPLGQGFGMGVGMALAERALANCVNRPGFPLIDHYTYLLVSDGDLMEGVASEAASLAGTMKLEKLVCIYDDNHISIEGETDLAFTENVQRRFQAYGWQVLRVPDGNDLKSLEVFLQAARRKKDKPSLLIVRTHIGYGSPKQDKAEVHGEPLGAEGVKATKEFFDWPLKPDFHIPQEAAAYFRRIIETGRRKEEEWKALLERYRREYPRDWEDFDTRLKGALPGGWDKDIPLFQAKDKPIATRSASGKVMNAIAKNVPHFLGGSADLAPSTKTLLMGYGDLGYARACSRNIHFGVREHAMGAMVNGMALHGGLLPYTGTFLVFSDYMRPALRLAAMMGVRAVFVFSHDSIGLGEDGPTHQPVEHLAGLRAVPGLTVIRPADANETAAAWRIVLQREGPAVLILTRQNVPILDSGRYNIAEGVAKGAYILSDSEEEAELLLIASGSDVHTALAAAPLLKKKGVDVRVVSMPSWELFREQPEDYRRQVLPPQIKARLAVEAGAALGWYQWVGDGGGVVGVDRFGASAPGPEVLKQYGLCPDNVVRRALALLKK